MQSKPLGPGAAVWGGGTGGSGPRLVCGPCRGRGWWVAKGGRATAVHRADWGLRLPRRGARAPRARGPGGQRPRRTAVPWCSSGQRVGHPSRYSGCPARAGQDCSFTRDILGTQQVPNKCSFDVQTNGTRLLSRATWYPLDPGRVPGAGSLGPRSAGVSAAGAHTDVCTPVPHSCMRTHSRGHARPHTLVRAHTHERLCAPVPAHSCMSSCEHARSCGHTLAHTHLFVHTCALLRAQGAPVACPSRLRLNHAVRSGRLLLQ